MKRLMIAVVLGLFVMGLGGVSFAGMMDSLQDKAEEAKEGAHENMDMKEGEAELAPGTAIEAQDAMKEEGGGMMDKVKETAKEKANEKINSLDE